MSVKIAIIGAGWYGCHLGLSFKSLGFDVVIYEKNERVLNDASGNNQFRLHLGFHYARHHGTRIQSRDGFMRFIERYPSLSREVTENIYAVPKYDSIIDFNTYRMIMSSSGLEYQETKENRLMLKGIDGFLHTPERVLLISNAREYFSERLNKNLRLGEIVSDLQPRENGVVVNGSDYDFVIDCTWGRKSAVPIDIFFEPTLLLYYECLEPQPALTLVDGPLGSFYPTEDPSIYTLSSVPHTPIGRFSSHTEAQQRQVAFSKEEVLNKKELMEAQISQYYPGFRDIARFMGPQFSMKTKPVGLVDDRSCYVFHSGRVITVMSGKIDTIFYAQERSLNYIEATLSGWTDQKNGSLREEIRWL